MKGFSKTNFLKEYIKLKIDKKDGILKDKLEDNFQTGKKKLLPFTLNPVSGSIYDGTCGLNGEFLRLKTLSNVDPIYSPQDTEKTLREKLEDNFKMPADDIKRFIKVFNDVMFENEKMMLKFARAGEGSRAIFLTGSGTAAMEASVMNCLNKKEFLA